VLAGIGINSGIYIWTAPAWLAWYVITTANLDEGAQSKTHSKRQKTNFFTTTAPNCCDGYLRVCIHDASIPTSCIQPLTAQNHAQVATQGFATTSM
jgi:hypothetical protein